MSLATRVLAAALLLGVPAFAGDTTESAWIQDFGKAQAKAAAEKKDLLIDFTGSDWCIWCKRLDTEVFSAGDFEKKIQEQFVLVKLDFPHDEKLVTPEIKKQNDGLMGRYGVKGFPTLFLTDAKAVREGRLRAGRSREVPHLRRGPP
jgi:thioredoxin-related protein